MAMQPAAVLWDAASRICSEKQAELLHRSHLIFFSKCFVKVQPYSSTDTATVWKNSSFILSEKSDFHMIDNL